MCVPPQPRNQVAALGRAHHVARQLYSKRRRSRLSSGHAQMHFE